MSDVCYFIFKFCRVCASNLEDCHVALDSTDETVNLRDYFPGITSPVDERVEVTLGEPTFQNPNSYESVANILREIGIKSGISLYGTGTREWLFLEVDGTIYSMLIELIFNTYVCDGCK